jgi:hypothetical protein
MEALIAGQRDPRTLAKPAKAGARKKTEALEEALRGFFTDHNATILADDARQHRSDQHPGQHIVIRDGKAVVTDAAA